MSVMKCGQALMLILSLLATTGFVNVSGSKDLGMWPRKSFKGDEMLNQILKHIPHWFRTRWPMKRFYWQKEELELSRIRASQYFDKYWSPQDFEASAFHEERGDID